MMMDFIPEGTKFKIKKNTFTFKIKRPKMMRPDEILTMLHDKYGKEKELYHQILTYFSRMTNDSLDEVVDRTHKMSDTDKTTLTIDEESYHVTKSEMEDLLLYGCGVKLT